MEGFRSRCEEIKKAAGILGLVESATLDEIKGSYRSLIQRWHPDRCKEDPEECARKTKEIIEAYRVLMAYCENYRYSFRDEDIMRNLSPREAAEEWWLKRFGDDPIWGRGKGE